MNNIAFSWNYHAWKDVRERDDFMAHQIVSQSDYIIVHTKNGTIDIDVKKKVIYYTEGHGFRARKLFSIKRMDSIFERVQHNKDMKRLAKIV